MIGVSSFTFQISGGQDPHNACGLPDQCAAPESPFGHVLLAFHHPFFAPILILVRILIEPPPRWQSGLCITLMLATIDGLLNLSSRIYHVGILLYGKRPTLPELRRWLQ